ncbi:MAG: YbjN domain-containing protein [Acidimicrobiales bacterium]
MPVERASADDLAELSARITAWAERERAENELVLAVDQHEPTGRWFVRLRGEDRDVITVWLTLRERTLHYETQFMPAPEENHAQLFEYLLRLNQRLYALRFAIGDEDALYLVGQLPWSAVDDDEIDRIVGSTYAAVEQYFASAMSIGYASKFRR